MQLERDNQHCTNNPLQNSDALLRAMIENLPGGATFVVDSDLRYLLAEGEALAIAGFKPEDFVGRTIFEVLPPELIASHEPRYRQALAGEPFEVEHHAHNRFYISRGTPLRSANGEVYGVMVVSYDITERKQTEAAAAADLEDTQRLHELSVRLVAEDDIQTLYQEIMAAAIALTRADAGTVQILDEKTQELVLLATQGIEQSMVDHFYRVNARSNTPCGIALTTGNRTFVNFDVPASEDPDGSCRMHVEAGLLSAQSTPLISRSSKAIGMVSTHWRKPYRPTERELRFLDLLARQAADLIEQRQAQIVLRESEEKYRSLFTTMDQGFCIIEKVETAPEQPSDFRYLTVNPAFERHTGMQDVIGKTIRDFVPDAEQHIMNICDAVMRIGQPQQFEEYVAALDRWIAAEVFPTEIPGQLAVLFSNISERKRTEVQLRRAAEMDAFRVKLADALRSLSDAVEIHATVTRIAMNSFDADRCYYCEIIDDNAIIRRDASREGLPSVAGVYPLSSFPILKTVFDAGHLFLVEDAHTTDLLDESLQQLCCELQVISFIDVPVIKEGKPVGVLCITQSTPRHWTTLETELAQETAERIWAAVERARAETSLRESEIQRVREQAAREQERQRAESLAELDRAKTLFFSNISHEFRTPLTLMLAPLQDALKILEKDGEVGEVRGDGKVGEVGEVGEDQTPSVSSLSSSSSSLSSSLPLLTENLQLAHRNSLRLLKLVNTLLDFSRIEAGRMEAVYEPTDLATFTTELASVFRSAIDRAGLRLIVDCPPLPESVYVDREMWEKIVLNLLSNAFKFTFEGEIWVSLRLGKGDGEVGEVGEVGEIGEVGEDQTPSSSSLSSSSLSSSSLPCAILQIQDTGTGIAPEHLPHLFERFYQVRGSQARTHEGSGIGLALVHELVRLHGGTIEVSSTVGEGTCFTIALPFGTDHLPSIRVVSPQENCLRRSEPERIASLQENHLQPARALASTTMGAGSYVEEAERWLPVEENQEYTIGDSFTTFASAHILLADDNADMREYLARILSDHVQVEAVADGATALTVAQERVPDLILSDVMMPGLNGFELLGALRANPRTREVPIILLSALAGEEAIVEGLEAGADDYLIKPFSAQELVSRVMSHLQIAQLRGEALQQERMVNYQKDEFISTISHELNTPLVAILGWTRMIRSNPPSSAMLSKALDTIERNATLQAKLVQDLLDISRIAAGKLRLNPQPIELNPVLETVIATMAQTAAGKGIDLIWQENVTEPVVVMGDSDRLSQVFINLLTNAIKFTPEGGRVEIQLINDAISQLPKSQNSKGLQGSYSHNMEAREVKYAEIRVMDTGIGIADDFLPHVFDRFRQAEGVHAAKGLGLGLAIAHCIVELHNGTIHADSAGEGQGTTFTIRLPLFQDSES